MKILFTGHRGFLGRELIPELSKEFEIYKFEGDLRNFNQLSDFVSTNHIERVIHAAVRGGRRFKVDDHSVLEENLASSINTLRLGLPMVAFCSGAIYGRQENVLNAREEKAGSLFPKDFYGQSKFLFRQLVKGDSNVTLLRFFNVFGVLETPERFLRTNISHYWKQQAMKVFQDFYMDFFYVQDSTPILLRWLSGEVIPNEMNLVYQEKHLLSEICNKINGLGPYKVEIEIDKEEHGSDYCGDGSVLASMSLNLKGLDYGLEKMFNYYRVD